MNNIRTKQIKELWTTPWITEDWKLLQWDNISWQFIYVEHSAWGQVDSVVWWTNVSIDNTDPINPVVNVNLDWVSASQLEFITESLNTGWRLLWRDSVNHWDIWQDAIDLSYSWTVSTTKWATWLYSLSEWLNTTSSWISSHAEWGSTNAIWDSSHSEWYSSTANWDRSHAEWNATTANWIGSHSEWNSTVSQNQFQHSAWTYNIWTSPDTIHETGIWSFWESWNIYKNAFEIYTDWRIRAPELSLVLHDNPKSLATKEYVDSASSGWTSTKMYLAWTQNLWIISEWIADITTLSQAKMSLKVAPTWANFIVSISKSTDSWATYWTLETITILDWTQDIVSVLSLVFASWDWMKVEVTQLWSSVAWWGLLINITGA